MSEADGLVTSADGRSRCFWAATAEDYRDYHDTEWGRPVHGDSALLERIVLEGFQSGLSWLTILRKRPAFRSAFADFDPAAVADFDQSDVERLLGDAGIVRHRRKIEAAITNAEATVHLARIYAGTSVYFPKLERSLTALRNRMIVREYNGSNVKRLARRWGLSSRHVRYILNTLADE